MVARLKDISEQVGVSIATVSRVLNGREVGGFISEETRQRIFAVAAELGYRPNLLARGLRGSRSSLIGLIVRDIADPFMSETLKGIHNAAVNRGFRLFLGHVAQPYTAIDYGAMFEHSHADGILLLGDMIENDKTVEFLTSKHRHIVGVVDLKKHREFPGVYTDNILGARLALDYLWDLGHRHIICVAEQGAYDRVLRVQEYQRWVHEHDLDEFGRVFNTDESPRAAFATGLEIFSNERVPTAAFAVTDRIAIGLLRAAYESNISVPKQISIVGFDNIDFSEFVIPPLTTISQSPSQMGYAAADLLINMIEQELDSRTVEDLMLTPELIIRQSADIPRSD
ncbi:MAG: LacI family DNA-binding transcriptional regulator [Chloroflexota bacterium]